MNRYLCLVVSAYFLVSTSYAALVVQAVQVTAEAVLPKLSLVAQVEPAVETALGFTVNGIVDQRFAQIGDCVPAHTVLAQLRDQVARHELSLAQHAKDDAQAQWVQAEQQYGMRQSLYQQGHLSKHQYALEQQRIDQASTNLNRAKTRYAQASYQLDQHRLKAPFSGCVRQVFIEPGGASGPTHRAFDFVSQESVVPLTLSHQMRQWVQLGAMAEVRTLQAPVVSVQGKVSELSSAPFYADSYRATVALPTGKPQLFHQGQTVEVRIPIASEQQWVAMPITALVAPTTHQVKEGMHGAVWLLDKQTMTVRQQDIDIAQITGETVWVSHGLSHQQWVVTTGQRRLHEGVSVQLTN